MNFSKKKQYILTIKVVVSLFLLTASQQLLANEYAIVNLQTTKPGMHRITYKQLLDRGVDLSGLWHDFFSITDGQNSIAIRTVGRKGNRWQRRKFGEGGYIEFYAKPVNNLYSKSRVYTLEYGNWFQLNKMRRASWSTSFRKRQTSVDYMRSTLVVEENNYYDFLSPSETDPWHFGQVYASAAGDTDATKVSFSLPGLVGDKADIDVEVYGIVDIKSDENDHHFVAKLNGVEIGDKQFDGNVKSVLSVSQAPVNSDNEFQLAIRGIASTPFDALGLNKVTVEYDRRAEMEDGYFEGVISNGQVIVSGVDESKLVWGYRRDGNDMSLLRLTSLGSNKVGFKTFGGKATYIISQEQGFETPEVKKVADEQDISNGLAEYLIISHNQFIGDELDELVKIRQQQYSVKVVDVEQIYGQYGKHVPSADAIKRYIQHASKNMNTKFVLLVGADTYDYKNILGTNSKSFVPTTYVATPSDVLTVRQTPSDAAYGDTNNDGIPEVPVGRLSVRTTGELVNVIDKIKAYRSRDGYAGRVLLAADKDDLGNGVSFRKAIDKMIGVMPDDWRYSVRSDFRAIPDVDGDQVAHDKLIKAFNSGVSVVSYIGHSAQRIWSRATPPLFKANEISGLVNFGKPALVTQWGCWNTYFVDPDGNNMADLLLVGGKNGAVAVLGASTLTSADAETKLSVELNKRMYIPGMTIGEAVIAAKKAMSVNGNVQDLSDVLLGWQIIGDPAIQVAR